MSIASIPETNFNFPSVYNVKLSIAGLAICKLASPESSIRFLRHVPKHRLKIIVEGINSSGMPCMTKVEDFLDNVTMIQITGAQSTNVYEYKPQPYGSEYELKMMLDLWYLHGHKLENRQTITVDRPTALTVQNCLFFTDSLTDNNFDILKNNTPKNIRRRFGETIGGYMKIPVGGKVTITFDSPSNRPIELPFELDGKDCRYEIKFMNTCFKPDGNLCESTGSPPSSPTDLVEVYKILKDNIQPIDNFDLKPLGERAINTGACLPVVEDPCLNCE